MDSTEVTRQANSLRDAIRKLQRERRFSSVYAADVAEQKDVLLERLAQFESSNKMLRKMIRTQQSVESSKSNLQMKLGEAESTNHLLRVKLDEQEKLALHSQSLHDEIGMKEGEIQSLSIRLQVTRGGERENPKIKFLEFASYEIIMINIVLLCELHVYNNNILCGYM